METVTATEKTEVPQENNVNEILSKDNQHVKLACSLHEKKYRKEKNLILFEGITIIKEAIKRKVKIQTLFFVKDSVKEEFETEITEGNIQCFKVSHEVMQKIATTDSAPPLIAISEKLKFLAIMPMASGNNDNLLEAFDQTFRVYNCNGFTIATLHVDPESKFLEDAMIDNNISVEWVAAQQQVPEIERTIGTVKDRIDVLIIACLFKLFQK